MIKTIKIFLLAFLLTFCFTLFTDQSTQYVSAAATITCNADGSGATVGSSDGGACGQGDPAANNKACRSDSNCDAIFEKYLKPFIKLLSATVGIVVVAAVIFGGIQFSSSGGDPQKVANAKKHITNAIIALVAYVLLFAFLNFIIPGGLV